MSSFLVERCLKGHPYFHSAESKLKLILQGDCLNCCIIPLVFIWKKFHKMDTSVSLSILSADFFEHPFWCEFEIF